MVRQLLQLLGSPPPAEHTPPTELGGVATMRQLLSNIVESVGPQEYILEQPALGANGLAVKSRIGDHVPGVSSPGQSARAMLIVPLAKTAKAANPITIQRFGMVHLL